MVKRSNEMLLPFYFRDIGAEPSSTPLVCAPQPRVQLAHLAQRERRIWRGVHIALGPAPHLACRCARDCEHKDTHTHKQRKAEWGGLCSGGRREGGAAGSGVVGRGACVVCVAQLLMAAPPN
eukprot:COSAG01_NODE_8523_length_2753_cov_37.942847_3_plen_122_part_00